MIEMQPLTQDALAREALKRLAHEKGALVRAERILECVAHNSVGLGEVLQDYAHQASGQLRDLIRAASHLGDGISGAEDCDILRNIHLVLKTVKSVLEMTPTAMLRNKAETIGERVKFSRADIAEVTHAFMGAPDITPLLTADDAGERFAAILCQGVPSPATTYSSASH